MLLTHRVIRPFAILLAVGLLAALIVPFATRSSKADQQTITIAPGDRVTVVCPTNLSGAVQGQQSTIECAPQAAPQGLAIAEVRGINDGGSISGKVNVEAVVTGQNIAAVDFKLDHDGQAPVTYSDRRAPYFFLGNKNGAPKGWDTTQYPDGAYMMTITASDSAGQSVSQM